MFDYDVYALVRRRLHDGGRLRRGGLAGRPPASSTTSAGSTTTTSITIEGHTDLAFSEDVATRFIGYGWNVTRVGDANDLDDARPRLRRRSRRRRDRPTLIIVDSHIGYGAPTKQDTHAAHGEPLGEEEIRLTKRYYGWPEDAKFLVPDGVREHFAARHRRARREAARRLDGAASRRYKAKYPEVADELVPDAAPAAARRLGQGASRRSRPTPRAWPAATRRARC